MTTVALLLGTLLILGWLISFIPRNIQEVVIIITALVGIMLLSSAPVMIVAILFELDYIKDFLDEIGFFTMMVSGIIIVIVMALFYQSFNNTELGVEEESEI